MNWWRFIWRTFVFYRRAHLGTLLGCAIGTAVITGALIVGDSVQYSLRQLTMNRLGRTEYALASGERFFRAQLADDLHVALGADVAPVTQLPGMAISAGGRFRLNRIQVLGVDPRFWKLGQKPFLPPSMADGEAVINRQLAARLQLRPGDELLVRIAKPGVLSREAAFALSNEDTVALRVKVKSIITESELGSFNLKIHQSAPYNLYLPLGVLAEKIGRPNGANLLLAAGKPGTLLQEADLADALQKHWTIADAGLELRTNSGLQYLELRSGGIFIPDNLAQTAFQAGDSPRGVLAYFVNRMSAGNRATPYSVVAGLEMPPVSSGLGDDELIANEWLARDLHVKAGDSVALQYYTIGPLRQLIEKRTVFRVHSVIPMTGMAADRELMPEIPGLSGLDNCRDWNPGIPIQLDQIRTVDEQYWKLYQGTPKAFISLKAAQTIWNNPYGALTAIRYPLTGRNTVQRIQESLNHHITPAMMGLGFRPVRREAIKAGTGTVDFGQLFLGLSIFLLSAALLLTGLLFHFLIESRSREIGILRALGYSPSQIGRLILVEGMGIAFLGGLLGVGLGIGYNQLILLALRTVWSGAAGANTSLHLHLEAATLLFGLLAGFGAAMAAILVATRMQTRRLPITAVQSCPGMPDIQVKHKSGWRLILVILAIICIPVMLLSRNSLSGESATMAFMGAGCVLLAGILAAIDLRLERLAGINSPRISIPLAGIRNLLRRRGRSMAIIGLLSAALFLVVAISANRRDLVSDADRRTAGTGGFSLAGETTVPMTRDLNNRAVRRLLGLDTPEYQDARFIQIRIKEGDDASCFNLNHVQRPRILGVDADQFARRHAFSFVKTIPGVDPRHPWTALNRELGPGVIPAFADYTTIVWALRKAPGDLIEYTADDGRKIRLKLMAGLANSIFQGNLLISETAFRQWFPGVSGANLLLVDLPRHPDKSNRLARQKALAAKLADVLADYGLEIIPAAERLQEFEAVENTYLSIFLILGGLGIMLGAGGIGILIVKSTVERRGEMALLRAIGYDKRALLRILWHENWMLLIIGAIGGTIAGLMAVLPSLTTPGIEFPWISLFVILAGLVFTGAGWIWLAARLAVRGEPLEGLREE